MPYKLRTSTSVFPASLLATFAPTASGARAPGRARSLICAFGLSGALFGAPVGIGFLASPPAYAQDQPKTEGGAQKKEDEESKRIEKEKAEIKKYMGEVWKDVQDKTLDWACESDGAKKAKAKEELDYANNRLDYAIRRYIRATSKEYKETQKELYLANETLSGAPPGTTDTKEHQEAVKKVREKQDEIFKKEIPRIRKALEEGKELTLAAPAECPTFATAPPSPAVHGGLHGGGGAGGR